MDNQPPIIDTGADSTPPAFAADSQPQQFIAEGPEKKKGNIGTIIFAILFVLALAGAGFLFITGMDKDSQIDSLTKKNKDLTAQLDKKGEEEGAKGDITGELLMNLSSEVGERGYSMTKLYNGLDGTSEIMTLSVGATPGAEIPDSYGLFYYREGAGAEWHLVAKAEQAVMECLYYDEGVAAAFGENLPCTAPAEDAPEENPEENPEETPSDNTTADNTTTE